MYRNNFKVNLHYRLKKDQEVINNDGIHHYSFKGLIPHFFFSCKFDNLNLD